jgi:ubiquinone/menaquinone biosynthesis C-methylase UbiE
VTSRDDPEEARVHETIGEAETQATRGRVLHGARGYDLLARLLLGGHERAFRDRLVRLARIESGERVLDVACGTGSLALAAARTVGPRGEVHGLDASGSMIGRARRKARKAGARATFITGVVESLPYPDGRFDVVLGTLMLHHLPPDERRQCAREMRRVLAPGGRVLAADFGTDTGRRGWISRIHRHRGGVGVEEIAALLTGAGLEIVESGAVGVLDLGYALARRS